MADNTTLNPGTGGDVIATDEVAGVKHQQVKIEFGTDGVATPVSNSNPLPTSVVGAVDTGHDQPLTDTQLRSTPVPISGTVTTGGLTDAQLRASAVPITGGITTGTVSTDNSSTSIITASGSYTGTW